MTAHPTPPTPAVVDGDTVREAVRRRYAAAAVHAAGTTTPAGGTPAPATDATDACCAPSDCCGPGAAATDCCGRTSCCGPGAGAAGADPITSGNYVHGEGEGEGLAQALAASLGCGNPTALIDLQPGWRVLDLGSGGGLDVLLSARRVGPDGFAYGVDMTDEMLDLARANARRAGATNVQFMRGTIEQVPLPDGAVDVVISNCVINLAADKDPVLAEAWRVLAPGGRFAVSDMVLTRPVPEAVQGLMGLWTGCVSGALVADDYVARLTRAGFEQAKVQITRTYGRADLEQLATEVDPGDLPADLDVDEVVTALDGALASAFVRAVKPLG